VFHTVRVERKRSTKDGTEEVRSRSRKSTILRLHTLVPYPVPSMRRGGSQGYPPVPRRMICVYLRNKKRADPIRVAPLIVE